MKNNMTIRIMMMERGITQFDLAEKLDVTPSWVSRLLRYPLSKENSERIRNAIEDLSKGVQ